MSWEREVANEVIKATGRLVRVTNMVTATLTLKVPSLDNPCDGLWWLGGAVILRVLGPDQCGSQLSFQESSLRGGVTWAVVHP